MLNSVNSKKKKERLKKTKQQIRLSYIQIILTDFLDYWHRKIKFMLSIISNQNFQAHIVI